MIRVYILLKQILKNYWRLKSNKIIYLDFNKKCKWEFKHLKKILSKYPLIERYILHNDASKEGLGAVSFQIWEMMIANIRASLFYAI